MLNKAIIICVLIIFPLFSKAQMNNQRDSTTLKLVKRLQQVIEMRAIDAGVKPVGWPNIVLIERNAVHVDSLYKYNISDIRKISISFDLPKTYGILSDFGVISIHLKESAVGK